MSLSILGLFASPLEDASSVMAVQNKQKTVCATPRLEKKASLPLGKQTEMSDRVFAPGTNLFWLSGAQGDLVKRRIRRAGARRDQQATLTWCYNFSAIPGAWVLQPVVAVDRCWTLPSGPQPPLKHSEGCCQCCHPHQVSDAVSASNSRPGAQHLLGGPDRIL